MYYISSNFGGLFIVGYCSVILSGIGVAKDGINGFSRIPYFKFADPSKANVAGPVM